MPLTDCKRSDWQWAFFWAAAYQAVLLGLILASIIIRHGRFDAGEVEAVFSAWDARHYLAIAERWYEAGSGQMLLVFFPGYPLLLRLSAALLPLVWAGVLISSCAAVIGFVFFMLFLRESGYDRPAVLRIMSFVWVFPAAVYFGAVYTEGLFLAETAAALFFLRRRWFWSAAVCSLLAAFTRNIGVLLFIPYAAACLDWPRRKVDWSNLLLGAIASAAGPLIYLGLDYQVSGDLFFFSKALQMNWYKHFSNPLQLYWRELTRLFTNLQGAIDFVPMGPADPLATLLFPLILMGYLLLVRRESQRLPPVLLLWAAAQWLIIASQSFWLSNCRYMLLILPLYVMLERIFRRTRLLYAALLLLSFSAWLRSIWLFAGRQWVF